MVPWMPAWTNNHQKGGGKNWQQKSWGQSFVIPPVQKPWLKQNQSNVKPWNESPFQGLQQALQSWKGGGGKGGGMPWQNQWQQHRKPPPALPANFSVDPDVRYTGTVNFYHKWKGYGFIDLADKGIVPNDRLFVHWRNIQSDDRYPFLVKDLEVEFNCLKWQERGAWGNAVNTVRAKNVTLIGGTSIAMQDDIDAQEKTFVGGQHLRYTGTLKFFNPRKGFGYVTMDQGYDVDASVPTELRVETAEVNSNGTKPMPMQNLAVEFGIWITNKGKHNVYNMTLPGGHPLTQDALENRITMGPSSYTGNVAIWNWRQGWGFIRADPSCMLPPRVVTKLAQQQQAAISRGRRVSMDDKMFYFRRNDCVTGSQPRKDSQVTFQLYVDDKGVGASEVMSHD